MIPKIFFDIELDDTIDDLSLVNIDTVQEIAFKEGVKIVVESVIGGNEGFIFEVVDIVTGGRSVVIIFNFSRIYGHAFAISYSLIYPS